MKAKGTKYRMKLYFNSEAKEAFLRNGTQKGVYTDPISISERDALSIMSKNEIKHITYNDGETIFSF